MIIFLCRNRTCRKENLSFSLEGPFQYTLAQTIASCIIGERERANLVMSTGRPPTLRSAHRGQFVRPCGKPRERQTHSIAFNLKDTLKHRMKHLFCAIGVAVGEVQLIPFEFTAQCAWTTYHAPKLVPGRHGV